ncbi:MAG: hypothetical protein SFU86_22175 [Pirellulaceae bacterium]|nr:hypothetical protein [Pirellulaceae bacterium]
MNYLTHGFRFTDEPYFLAGTAAPDWLNVIDRKMRLRGKTAAEFVADEDAELAAFARGVVRHHHDDGWFHQTAAFHDLSLAFTVEIRGRLPADDGFRPSFLGHILVELLLDATLAAERPEILYNYYNSLTGLDPFLVQNIINRLATRTSDGIALLIPRFCQERFLYDYADDQRLLVRLNHVLRRVGLAQLPADLAELFPAMRLAVADRRDDLLPPENMNP